MTDAPFRSERISVSDETVRALVAEQFPDLADQEIGRRSTLEDHIAVRIGDKHGAIFPTVPGLDEYFERAARLLRPQLPNYTFPYSAPIATGQPGDAMPYHWSLVEWISASTAGFVPLNQASAEPLGRAIREIHSTAYSRAVGNPRTSQPLLDLTGEWDQLLREAAHAGAPENRELDTVTAARMWEDATRAPLDVPTAWTHGNLEPRAILSDRGDFCGVLLWQYFGAGDPAGDLGYMLNLLPKRHQPELLESYGPISRHTFARAKGYQLLELMRLIETGDPFLVRLAWERLIELDLAHAG